MSGKYWHQQLGIMRCGSGLKCPFCYARTDWNRRLCMNVTKHGAASTPFDCSPGHEMVGNQFHKLRGMKVGQIVLNGYTDPCGWSSGTWRTFLETVRDCPQHQFLLLTKRPTCYRSRYDRPAGCIIAYPNQVPNLWLGFTATTGEEFRRRMAIMRELNWTGRTWCSYEPIRDADFAFEDFRDVSWVTVGCETPGKPTVYLDACIGLVVHACHNKQIPVWTKSFSGTPVREMSPELARVFKAGA